MRSITKSQSILIDFIRGISAQMVLVGHLIGFYTGQQIMIQNLGVIVFFVLSGHLVTISALRLKKEYFNFKFFMIDRFARIYAGLVPAIIICVIIDIVNINIIPIENLLLDINNLNLYSGIISLLNLGGLPNPILIGEIFQPIGSMRPLWTVALEWWIYLFLGLVFILTNKEKRIAFLFITISIILMLVQIIMNKNYIGFFIVNAWLLSSSLILLNQKLRLNIVSLLIAMIIFVLMIYKQGLVHFYDPIYVLSFIIIYFSSLEIVKNIRFGNFFKKFSQFISSYSYSLYLLHYTLIVLFKPLLKTNDIVEIFIIFIICNVTAFIFYNIFESKFVIIRNFLKAKF